MPPAGRKTPVPAGLILLFIGLAIVITIGGSLFYQSQEEQIGAQVTGDLTSIAQLKAHQITAWRGERLGDAAVLSRDRILIAGLKDYLSSPDPGQQERILDLFDEISTSYHYRDVRLVDPAGRVVIGLDSRKNTLEPSLVDQAAGVLATGKPVLTDLMPGSDDASPVMYAIAPLIDTGNGRNETVGTIILTIDPATDLYPLVQTWPVPSGSAETLLVERQGDHVLYLNTLRHRTSTALNLSIPMTRTDVPAVQAVLGTTGPYTGTDYRGVEVLSVLVPVSGSPWFMVAKVDTAEAFAPWRSRAAFIIVLVAGTLAAAGIIAGLLWQRRQKYYYQSLFGAEMALREEEEKGRQALKESEQRLRRFYDSGLFGVVYWNMDGAMTDANDTFLSMVGYTREDLAAGQLDWGRMTPPEFAALDRKAVEELKETGINRIPYEKEYIRKDGNRLPILFACAMLDERRFDGVAFILDISLLKQARASLAAEQQRYRELFENVPVGMSRSTPGPGARILAANPADLRIFDAASPEELLAAPPESLYADPEDRLRFTDELMRTGTVKGMEIRFRTVRGRVFWGRISSKRYVAEDGTVFFDNVVEDISVQKEASENLRISEERFRGVFDRSTAGKSLTSAPDGRLLRINQAFADMLGYTIGELEKVNWTDITYPDDIPESREGIRGLMAGEKTSYRMEMRYFHKSGRIVWADVSTALLGDSEGRPLYLMTTILDITGRKAAETELRSTNAFLDKVIEMSPFAMWIADSSGTVTRVNRSLCETIHLAPEDIIGTYNVLRDTNLEHEGVMPAVSAVFEHLTPARFSIPWKAADAGNAGLQSGRDMFIDVSLFPITGPDGRLTHVVCQWIDITERKRAEETLRETNEYLRNLITYANAPIIVWDPQFRITRFNHAFEHLTGKTEQDVTGQDIGILFPPETKASSLDLIYKTLAGERWETVEIPILHASGTTRVVLWNSANITRPDGTIVSTIAQGQDITNRKEAEQALRESERKFRILFTSMIEGSALHEVLYSAAGEPAEYRILDVNPAYERITGINRSEAIGRTGREVYRGESPPFLETYARVAATGRAEAFEVYFPPLQKHFSISVFSPEQGKFATIFEDITGRKQAEAQREALIRELEQKNAELERFTYTVSHDLKSPLITIKGFAGLLEDDVQKSDPDLLKKDVKRITDAADTMQQLLTDVLELSRIGRIVAPPRETGFGDIVREAADLLAGPLAERGVTLEIAPALPVVNVDPTRIREVLVNLIENAIKFTGNRKNPVIRIGAMSGDGGPVFFVQDNGIGIDPRYLTRIFNLFEKLDPSVPGTGIGLTIVKRIIESHGGKIWAESEGPGKGTTFRFTLPLLGGAGTVTNNNGQIKE
jgi:PAS domain S-box-containing protein